jgi:hypothetical protein
VHGNWREIVHALQQGYFTAETPRKDFFKGKNRVDLSGGNTTLGSINLVNRDYLVNQENFVK